MEKINAFSVQTLGTENYFTLASVNQGTYSGRYKHTNMQENFLGKDKIENHATLFSTLTILLVHIHSDVTETCFL